MLHFLSSCFWLLIPAFLWNLLLWRYLPPEFQKETWDDIPRWLSLMENAARIIVFLFSAVLLLQVRTAVQVAGLAMYGAGSLVYFASWIPQIRHPGGRWSRSLPGFCAPAYTPLVWLAGIALMGQRMLFDVWYRFWIYILLSVAFVGLHTFHAVSVHGRVMRGRGGLGR